VKVLKNSITGLMMRFMAADLQSFYAINEVYLKRLSEVSGIYKDILSQTI
jgi:hypothetical protein